MTKTTRTFLTQLKTTKNKRAGSAAYLDTTIFYKLMFGHSLQRNMIRQAIHNRRIVTARYVFTELRNQAITLISIYFHFRNEASIDDAAAAIADEPRARYVKAAISILVRLVNNTKSKAEALAAIENTIFAYIETAEAMVDDFIDDGLNCPLAKVAFSREPGLTTAEIFARFRTAFKCEIETPVQCKSDNFRDRKASRISLVRIADGIKSNGVKKLQETLEKLHTGRMPHARGLRYRCSKIGDLLIALQCPPAAEIISLDTAFEDLSKILKRDAQVLPSLQAIRKS